MQDDMLTEHEAPGKITDIVLPESCKLPDSIAVDTTANEPDIPVPIFEPDDFEVDTPVAICEDVDEDEMCVISTPNKPRRRMREPKTRGSLWLFVGTGAAIILAIVCYYCIAVVIPDYRARAACKKAVGEFDAAKATTNSYTELSIRLTQCITTIRNLIEAYPQSKTARGITDGTLSMRGYSLKKLITLCEVVNERAQAELDPLLCCELLNNTAPYSEDHQLNLSRIVRHYMAQKEADRAMKAIGFMRSLKGGRSAAIEVAILYAEMGRFDEAFEIMKACLSEYRALKVIRHITLYDTSEERFREVIDFVKNRSGFLHLIKSLFEEIGISCYLKDKVYRLEYILSEMKEYCNAVEIYSDLASSAYNMCNYNLAEVLCNCAKKMLEDGIETQDHIIVSLAKTYLNIGLLTEGIEVLNKVKDAISRVDAMMDFMLYCENMRDSHNVDALIGIITEQLGYISNKSSIIKFYSFVAEINTRLSKYDIAISYANKIMDSIAEVKDKGIRRRAIEAAGEAYYFAGRKEYAFEIASAYESEVKMINIWYDYAQKLIENGDIDAAINIAKDMPNCEELHWVMCSIVCFYANSGQFESAMNYAIDAELNSNFPIAWVIAICLSQGKQEEAEVMFSNSKDKYHTITCLMQIMNIYQRRGEWKTLIDAIMAFSSSVVGRIQDESERHDSLAYIARYCALYGDFERASSLIEEIKEKDSKVMIYFNLAEECENSNQHAAAREYYEAIIEIQKAGFTVQRRIELLDMIMQRLSSYQDDSLLRDKLYLEIENIYESVSKSEDFITEHYYTSLLIKCKKYNLLIEYKVMKKDGYMNTGRYIDVILSMYDDGVDSETIRRTISPYLVRILPPERLW